MIFSAPAPPQALIQEWEKRVTPKMISGVVTGSAYTDIVNISDKGVLTGISMMLNTFTAPNTANLKIIIDGVTIYDSDFLSFEKIGDHRSLSFNHKFDVSLQIQHKINAVSMGQAITKVAYTTD